MVKSKSKSTVPLSAVQIETLRAIHDRGPLYDGDVPSKAIRDELLEMDLIEKVVVGGEQGFQACTYFGSSVLESISHEIGRLKMFKPTKDRGKE